MGMATYWVKLPVIVPVRGVSCILVKFKSGHVGMVIVPVRGVSCIEFYHQVYEYKLKSSSP